MNDKIEKLLRCDDCKFATCEQCEISWNDKKMIREYIQEQELLIDKMKRFILNKGLMCDFLDEEK